MTLDDLIKRNSVIATAERRNLSEPIDSIPIMLPTDFGEQYQAATVAAGQTLVAMHNNVHGTGYTLQLFPSKPFESFEMQDAAKSIKPRLESALNSMNKAGIDKAYPLTVAFVVDPDKNRDSVVTEFSYKGRSVFIAHPDKGQVSDLLFSTWKGDGSWGVHGTSIVDHTTAPDRQIASETAFKWDGQGTYVLAAVTAALTGGIQTIGKKKNWLFFYGNKWGVDFDGKVQKVHISNKYKSTSSPPPAVGKHRGTINTVVHYIGEERGGFAKFSSNLAPETPGIIHFANYGTEEDISRAAAAVEFAGINIFQDAAVNHIIVYDKSRLKNNSEYVVAELGVRDAFGDNLAAKITAVVPNDGTSELLFKLYKPERWGVIDGETAADLTAQVLDRKYLGNHGEIVQPDTFEVREENGMYNVAIAGMDHNGNVRLSFNPEEKGFMGHEIGSVDIYQEDKPIGSFKFQDNYDRHSDQTKVLACGYGSGEKVSAQLIPSASGDRFNLSRRPRLELSIPYGHLTKALEGSDLEVGSRLNIKLHYK